ncbi:zinc-ribbon domain-containing protein [uncultured Lactobacillus sp.]|uniref:zinc-ribbon domain-containing protein n=1 Tax=uncultured Lactobacillus sp. TaxID=153152 RepID=UPI002620221C|nr:zinc ribbon domain-containing protein [uncultured Lactobacillus sp.]
MKKFCPNCGGPLKPDDKFCKKCGSPVNANKVPQRDSQQPAQADFKRPTQQPKLTNNRTQGQPNMQRPHRPKKSNKKVIAIVVSVLVILLAGGGFWYFTQKSSNNQASVAKTTKTHKKTPKKVPKKEKKKEYSNKIWMLMGYMAYARKNYEKSENTDNTGDLVKAVVRDFSDGTLEAEQNSQSTYTVSNKYGSVDVAVNKKNVKVTNDGTKVTSKSELKKTFGKYKSQIEKVSGGISENTVSEASANKEKKNKSNVTLSDGEMIVAAILTRVQKSSVKDQINVIKTDIDQSLNSTAKKIDMQNYIWGLIEETDAGVTSYSVAYNFSSSRWAKVELNNDTHAEFVSLFTHAPGLESVEKKKISKKELIEKYGPYKQDLDDILNGLEKSKSHHDELSKQIYNQQSDNSTDTNDNDDDDDSDD